jgi:hypothetical protein
MGVIRIRWIFLNLFLFYSTHVLNSSILSYSFLVNNVPAVVNNWGLIVNDFMHIMTISQQFGQQMNKKKHRKGASFAIHHLDHKRKRAL